ncbi:MAG: hypothetical protein JW834_04455 [Candidatus Diapherotrites archaeon]|nr:hypothetical protein [Candidatus Diapherotrites archaeon]
MSEETDLFGPEAKKKAVRPNDSEPDWLDGYGDWESESTPTPSVERVREKVEEDDDLAELDELPTKRSAISRIFKKRL